MKNKKKEHIHHFVQEFAFEGTSDEKESRPKSEPFFTIDGQLGMLKKTNHGNECQNRKA